MPGGFDIASEGISAAAGLLQTGLGFAEEKKADKELKRLHTPFYKIQDEYQKNLKLAEEMAGSGLPDATKSFLTRESERGLGTGIEGILKSGGSPNDIARLFDVYDSSVSRTAAEDAQARLGNIKNLMDVQSTLAGQKNIQFGVNELQPYQSALDSIQKRKEAGIQNMFGGLQTLAGTAGAASSANQNSQLLDQLKKMQMGNPNAAMFNRLFTPMADMYRSSFSGSLGVSGGTPASTATAFDTGYSDPVLTEDYFKN